MAKSDTTEIPEELRDTPLNKKVRASELLGVIGLLNWHIQEKLSFDEMKGCLLKKYEQLVAEIKEAKTMTDKQREAYRNYARAIGREDAETMTDEQLTSLMDYITKDCAKFGSD